MTDSKKAKKQVIVIHGGSAYEKYADYLADLKAETVDLDDLRRENGWKDNLQARLGNDFEVLRPQMPNRENATYLEWKVWFDKFTPLFNDEVVLVGHSLGGIFLAKYLSENKFPKGIFGTFLVAAPYHDDETDHSLADFVLTKGFDLFEEQSDRIFIYHSKDDPVVPFLAAMKYNGDIEKAELVSFEGRGHFNQAEFPEIEQDIKSIFPKK
jgi:hypothetical protein